MKTRKTRLNGPLEDTESIEVTTFAADVTQSGSFNITQFRKTSFSKLLHALPVPALLIDDSHQIIFANQDAARLTPILRNCWVYLRRKYRSFLQLLRGLSLSWKMFFRHGNLKLVRRCWGLPQPAYGVVYSFDRSGLTRSDWYFSSWKTLLLKRKSCS